MTNKSGENDGCLLFHRCSALASCSAELPAIPGDNFVILTKIPQFVILVEMNESGYAGLIIYAATPRLDSRLRPSASARMTAVCYFTILLFVILTKIPQFVILVEMNESGYAGLIIYAATPRLDSRLRPSASARMTAVCYFTILLFVILTKIPQFVILAGRRGSSMDMSSRVA